MGEDLGPRKFAADSAFIDHSRGLPDVAMAGLEAACMLLFAVVPILASAAQPDEPPKPITVTAYRWAPFISPMGEPFRSRAPDDDTLARWFHQADGNRDGMLTADEMRADAERFFATLDSDRDGRIDPEERMTYESEIAPEIQVNSQWKRTRQEPPHRPSRVMIGIEAIAGGGITVSTDINWTAFRARLDTACSISRSPLPAPMRISTGSSRWTNSGAPPRIGFSCSTAIARARLTLQNLRSSCLTAQGRPPRQTPQECRRHENRSSAA